MSRNKMIKFVHETTGLSYGECRRRLKESNWDVWKATGIEETSLLDDFAEAIGNTVNLIVDAMESLVTSILNIDWREVADACNKMTKEMEDEDRVLLPDGQDPDSDSSGEGHRL